MERNIKTNAPHLQLVTLADLESFKQQLLAELRQMLFSKKGAPEKKWLKSREVRTMLGISPGKLQTLRSYGQIPFTRVGGVIYYDHADIEKMLVDAKQMKKTY